MAHPRVDAIHSRDAQPLRRPVQGGHRTGMDMVFEALAVAGDGVFSAAQAAALGVDHAVIERARRAGRLVRLTRGWYATATAGRSPEAWHRLRTRAVLESFGAPTMATHHSALVLLGLPAHDADLAVVHVGRASSRRTRAVKGRVLHQIPAAPALAVHRAPGLPRCAPPAAAVVQAGLLNGPRAALVAADDALRQAAERDPSKRGVGATTREALDDAVLAYRRTSGIAAVGRILRLADARAESVGETLLRHDFHLLRIPVEPQFTITVGRSEYRADLRIRGTRILVEFDGLEKYDDGTEKRREDERERQLKRDGWLFVRFTWPELGKWALIRGRVDEVANAHGITVPTLG